MKIKHLLFATAIAFLTFSCDKTSDFVPVCDGSAPTYDADVAALISQKCLQCHGAGSSNGNFSTYSGLSAVTSNGKFEQEVLTDRTMPQTGSLSEAELNQIKCWVENGFPEN
ncbi:MAG: mono/diheme cytochrome c family protein [Crocinitomicaceae bacterium]|jgi:mono/diheme cytochrome c family protein